MFSFCFLFFFLLCVLGYCCCCCFPFFLVGTGFGGNDIWLHLFCHHFWKIEHCCELAQVIHNYCWECFIMYVVVILKIVHYLFTVLNNPSLALRLFCFQRRWSWAWWWGGLLCWRPSWLWRFWRWDDYADPIITDNCYWRAKTATGSCDQHRVMWSTPSHVIKSCDHVMWSTSSHVTESCDQHQVMWPNHTTSCDRIMWSTPSYVTESCD